MNEKKILRLVRLVLPTTLVSISSKKYFKFKFFGRNFEIFFFILFFIIRCNYHNLNIDDIYVYIYTRLVLFRNLTPTRKSDSKRKK